MNQFEHPNIYVQCLSIHVKALWTNAQNEVSTELKQIWLTETQGYLKIEYHANAKI